jgi:hypothetical protein
MLYSSSVAMQSVVSTYASIVLSFLTLSMTDTGILERLEAGTRKVGNVPHSRYLSNRMDPFD